ncbi:MAG: nitrilase-related carbon-nitrogen hydrolase, partial [Bryobacteraceae bacterium]
MNGNLRSAAAQFEHRNGDKPYNLSVIRKLAEQAAAAGAEAIAFHECCISGYGFARRLSREQMLALAEPVPQGESVQALVQIARETNVTVLAGLFERDTEDRLYNTYLAVDGSGVIAKHRKLHPFINSY